MKFRKSCSVVTDGMSFFMHVGRRICFMSCWASIGMVFGISNVPSWIACWIASLSNILLHSGLANGVGFVCYARLFSAFQNRLFLIAALSSGLQKSGWCELTFVHRFSAWSIISVICLLRLLRCVTVAGVIPSVFKIFATS